MTSTHTDCTAAARVRRPPPVNLQTPPPAVAVGDSDHPGRGGSGTKPSQAAR